MGILFPPPGRPEPAWQWRYGTKFLRTCSFLVPRLKEWNEVIHMVGVTSLVLLLIGLFWKGPWEEFHKGIEFFGGGLFGVYWVIRAVLFFAKRAHYSTIVILSEWDRAIDGALKDATHSGVGLPGYVRFIRTADDLDSVVTLTHDSLGIQHEDRGFSRQRRTELYFGWVKANPYSIMLLTPTFGRAAGETIGVSIILPLRNGKAPEIWNGCGVLRLGEEQILPGRSKSISSVLIDTLLLRGDLVDDYQHLAVNAFHFHLARFYSARSWPRTTLYSVTLKPKICKLLQERGFEAKGRSVEGEFLFEFVVQHVTNLTPIQRNSYERTLRLLKSNAAKWSALGELADQRIS